MERRFKFGPHPAAGWILGLRGSQLAGVAFFMVGTLYAVRAGGFGALVYVAGLAALTLLVVALPVFGHTMVEWVPIGGRYALQRVSGVADFSSRGGSYLTAVVVPVDEDEDEEAEESGGVVLREVEPCVSLPGELSDLEILQAWLARFGGVELGVVYNARDLTYTTTIRAATRAFYLLGIQQREQQLARFGRLLAAYAQEDSPVRRLAWYQRSFFCRPFELAHYFDQHRRADLPERQLTAMRQLLAAQRAGGADRELLVCLQVDLKRMVAEKAAQKLSSDSREGALALVSQCTADLVDRLDRINLLASHTDVSSPPVPSARLLAQTIRDGLDPFSRGERDGAPVGQPPGVEPQNFGPRVRRTRAGYVQCDGALHTTGYLAQWPRTDVRATFLQPLLMDADVTRTVGVVMDILPPRKAMRKAERSAEGREAEHVLRGKLGRRTTARDRQQLASSQQREDEIAAGHALVRFTGYVTVSVPEEEGLGGLDSAFARARGSALNSGLQLEKVWCQQDVALMHTLPLCRGLI